MNHRSRWILSIIAVFAAGTFAQAQDVVLQDGGVVVASNNGPPANDPVTTGGDTTKAEESPEPATLTLLGLGGLGALWSARRRKAGSRTN